MGVFAFRLGRSYDLWMAMTADLAQVHLRSGTTVLTCWLEARVKRGDR
jgi:hypothetical protein